MGRTWGDLQRECLQLMRSHMINGKDLWSDSDNLDYFSAMPEAANYALRDLASEAAPLVRKLTLSLNPVPNMLGDNEEAFEVKQSLGEEIIYLALSPKTFYFEVDNLATIHLEAQLEDGTWVDIIDPINNTTRRNFSAHSGRVIDADGIVPVGPVRLRFAGDTAYNIRNVAFYNVNFALDDIPPFTRYDRYDLKAMTAGQPGFEFLRLAPNESILQSANSYRRSDDFYIEGDGTIVFDHYSRGQWDIYYYAYPTPLRKGVKDGDDKWIITPTPTDFEPELNTEALDIVPLFMASRLYSEERPELASLYLNQYMVRRAELANRQEASGSTETACESGWW